MHLIAGDAVAVGCPIVLDIGVTRLLNGLYYSGASSLVILISYSGGMRRLCGIFSPVGILPENLQWIVRDVQNGTSGGLKRERVNIHKPWLGKESYIDDLPHVQG